jgi:hypothetical protein
MPTEFGLWAAHRFPVRPDFPLPLSGDIRARIGEELSLLGLELNESRNEEAASVISTEAVPHNPR